MNARRTRSVRAKPASSSRRSRPRLTSGPATLSPMRLDESGMEGSEEPFILTAIYMPEEYLGAVMKPCEDRRGLQRDLRFLGQKRVILHYELPLAEIVFDFYDRLKSVSRGYASLDYEFLDFSAVPLVKLYIQFNI